MGQALIPFAFEDHLVRSVVVNGMPWFVGRDICDALDLAKHDTALARLDDDEKAPHSVGTPGGTQTMIIVSEPGVYRLVFTSRKAEAERFKRWLAHEVLPRLRREGAYRLPEVDETGPDATPLDVRLRLVREARVLFGKARARALWQDQKLPAVPQVVVGDGKREARECLGTLLQADHRGRMLRDWIEVALAGSDEADLELRAIGIRIEADTDTFLLLNTSSWLNAEFADTEWGKGRWPRVIRRLPGVELGGNVRMGDRVSRSTRIPGRYLDIGPDPFLRAADLDG